MNDPIFVDNPKLERYYKTSDGQAFYTPGDAANHAKTLKNKNVKEVENPALMAVDSEEVADKENDDQHQVTADDQAESESAAKAATDKKAADDAKAEAAAKAAADKKAADDAKAEAAAKAAADKKNAADAKAKATADKKAAADTKAAATKNLKTEE